MLATPPLFTAEDLLRLQPPNGRSELIAGRMLVREPVGYEHGRIAGRLLVALGSHVARHQLGDVLAAETGFTLRRNPDTVRGPNVAFLTTAQRPRATTRGYAGGAPDLVAEVRSPGDREAAVRRP
jgi:Uma2 family endonuclease